MISMESNACDASAPLNRRDFVRLGLAAGELDLGKGLAVLVDRRNRSSGGRRSGFPCRGEGRFFRRNVLLGGSISSGGSKVTVQGSVTVGSNQFSDTNINAGGIEVSVPTGSGGFAPLPVCEPPAPVVVGVPTATVRWSRYL